MSYSNKGLLGKIKIFFMLAVFCVGVFGPSALGNAPPPPPPPDCSELYQEMLDKLQDLLNELLEYEQVTDDLAELMEDLEQLEELMDEMSPEAWKRLILMGLSVAAAVASGGTSGALQVIAYGTATFAMDDAVDAAAAFRDVAAEYDSTSAAVEGAAGAAAAGAAAAAAAAAAASAAAAAAQDCCNDGGTGCGDFPPMPPPPDDWEWPYSPDCPVYTGGSYPCDTTQSGCQSRCASNQCNVGGPSLCEPAIIIPCGSGSCYYLLAGAYCSGYGQSWVCNCTYMLTYNTCGR